MSASRVFFDTNVLIYAVTDQGQKTEIAKALVFQGGDADGVLADLREHFETVKTVKPQSSRKGSSEVYWVALNKR